VKSTAPTAMAAKMDLIMPPAPCFPKVMPDLGG
jgi:hypothetical protein